MVHGLGNSTRGEMWMNQFSSVQISCDVFCKLLLRVDEKRERKNRNTHPAGCVSELPTRAVFEACCFFPERLPTQFLFETCTIQHYFTRLPTSQLNTSPLTSPSDDPSLSSQLCHPPSCVRLFCYCLRARARERSARARVERRRAGGRSTRASSGLAILFAWLGR
jgi:hypothetical protein